MKKDDVSLLICPETKRQLEVGDVSADENGRIKEGTLVEPVSGRTYPIVNFIPRFVSADNYTSSFGFQWNKHVQTQYDKYSGFDVSRKRFFEESKWEEDLKGETILEVGSGSGRFTTHALETGATIVSFDFSNAVEANYESNGSKPNLLLVQANVYNMPFPSDFFDRAYCFGVLQHTPDPRKSFMSIIPHIKPGGKLATDVYLKNIRIAFHIKYWMRLITKNREPERLYTFVKKYVDTIWPLVRVLRKNAVGQKLVSRFVAEYSNQYPDASDATLKEWAILDTFDWLSPAYDKPQTLRTFRSWHEDAGLTDIEVHRGYNGLEGRATRSNRGTS